MQIWTQLIYATAALFLLSRSIGLLRAGLGPEQVALNPGLPLLLLVLVWAAGWPEPWLPSALAALWGMALPALLANQAARALRVLDIARLERVRRIARILGIPLASRHGAVNLGLLARLEAGDHAGAEALLRAGEQRYRNSPTALRALALARASLRDDPGELDQLLAERGPDADPLLLLRQHLRRGEVEAAIRFAQGPAGPALRRDPAWPRSLAGLLARAGENAALGTLLAGPLAAMHRDWHRLFASLGARAAGGPLEAYLDAMGVLASSRNGLVRLEARRLLRVPLPQPVEISAETGGLLFRLVQEVRGEVPADQEPTQPAPQPVPAGRGSVPSGPPPPVYVPPARTVPPYATIALAGLCTLVFLYTWVIGATPMTPGALSLPRERLLYDSGALLYPFVFYDDAWWRLASSTLLHAHGPHLLFNLLGLLALGAPLEPRLGPWRMLVVFLLSASGGMLIGVLRQYLAYGFEGPDVLFVGASGGLFGWLGLYVPLAFANWRLGRGPEARRALTWVLTMLLLQAAIDHYFLQGSSPLHMAGFGWGVLVGVFVWPARRLAPWMEVVMVLGSFIGLTLLAFGEGLW